MGSIGDNVAAAVSVPKLEKLLSMKGGKGEASYANNSQAQASHARSMFHFLEETLDTVHLHSWSDEASSLPFQVADLGCSSGTNTIHTIDVIIKHMIKRMEECLAATGHRNYFAAGVPGSFYRRLFPARSIDVFHSAFSLHWLSQVPESVVEKRSGAYNRGKVYIHGAKESTAGAYRSQFQTDLATFLKARSLELKKGGSMFLVCLGRSSSDPTDHGGAGILFGTHFQDAWHDLVLEGLLSSEKRDDFNIPVYAPSLQEFKEVVEANGCFTINKLELFKGGSPLVVDRPDDAGEVGRALANSCRSVSGVLVEAHIGEKLSEELFLRVERRGTANAKDVLDKLQFFHIVASLSLP
ncbi:IAA carboxylmethyltransferase 1 [Euphorbia peplus]|nr:IAA carboxylmethyltransferase 1 [Euphorbia peplus]